MKSASIAWGICAAIVATGSIWTWPFPVVARAERAAAADSVEKTLRREAAEGGDDRGELLSSKVLKSPQGDAAYWQSGFVYDSTEKEWLRWDEIQERAAKDDRLERYRQMREKAVPTIPGRMELAGWCRKHRLEDQARSHLTQVLELDPDHAEARKQLGFRLVDGTWVDDRDTTEARALTRKVTAAAIKWIKRVQKLRERLSDDNADQRAKAQTELAAIRDPEAVDAIDTVFCRPTDEKSLLGIELLKNIKTPRSSAVLAWHAAYSPWDPPWQPVGRAAATALQFREKHDYVPLLLEAAEPCEPPTYIADNHKGANSSSRLKRSRPYIPTAAPLVQTTFRLDFRVSTFSWNTVERLKEHPNWWQVPGMRFNAASPNPVARTTVSSTNQGLASSAVRQRQYYTVQNGQIQNRVTQNSVVMRSPVMVPGRSYAYPSNWQAASDPQSADSPSSNKPTERKILPRGEFSEAALAEATGEKGPRSPSQWRDWWDRYNDVYSPSIKFAKAPATPDPKTPANGITQAQWGDCLAGGTLICAETGPTAIEQIAVGDRVFCRDPETGRLALKSVLRKTVRPAGRLLKIRVGDDEFEASGGHVFWVAGQGWGKARDLREGMRLHTLRGTVPVSGIEPGKLQVTYGVVTADFHTFFAGKGMILTHDNTIRPPTKRIVPGLAAKSIRPVTE